MSGKRMKQIRQTMYDYGFDPKRDRKEYRKVKRAVKRKNEKA